MALPNPVRRLFYSFTVPTPPAKVSVFGRIDMWRNNVAPPKLGANAWVLDEVEVDVFLGTRVIPRNRLDMVEISGVVPTLDEKGTADFIEAVVDLARALAVGARTFIHVGEHVYEINGPADERDRRPMPPLPPKKAPGRRARPAG